METSMKSLMWHAVGLLAAAFWLYAGTLHFLDPQWFAPIVPPIPGSATFWVYVSGAAELALGIGFLLPRLRNITGLGSAVFLVCVYPANIYMWMYNIELGDGSSLSSSGHVIRLLLQVFGILLSLWVWRLKVVESKRVAGN